MLRVALFKVAAWVENTEVFKIGSNFANRTYFANFKMKKHYFLLWAKETAFFFPYFYHEIIFYSAELFDCAVNFKILFEHPYIFKHKDKSNIKGAVFELRSSHLFRDQPYKEVLEVKCQVSNFTGILSFLGVFENFGHIFLELFLQKFS